MEKGILDYSNYYFVGIGGIGMSALAQYFLNKNKNIFGYDRISSKISKRLETEGAKIIYNDSQQLIEESSLKSSDTLVIYTPAIQFDNLQLSHFNAENFRILKRSEVLGEITKDKFCLAIAGTHGKTTTSSILAHILVECNVKVTAFLGGITANYDSNYIERGEEVCVVEADEYDRSFLCLSPDIACITSMDADHLDIYGGVEAMHDSFREFSKKLKPNGKLLVKQGLPISGFSYGLEDESDYSAQNISIKNATYHFDLKTPKSVYKDFQLNLAGRHNLSNAIIALAMSVEYGCPPQQLAKALASFKGVERRFQYHIKKDALVYVDDYAHHPAEINAVFNAVEEMFPDKQALVVFQPHLYSRTRDFADEFGKALSQFSSVLLLDIYPAREAPLEGVTSSWLLEKIENPSKSLIKKENLVNEILKRQPELLITMGAGDIGEEVEQIKKALLNESTI
ncbi:MAG: UDP-N-acetylmuramate--L-alanine ligase [Flavobacteriaceae bacterium]|nr:UDP-N-acetylmuramate--L-alanine ligase [Flavobacteriaceae bacterium]